MKKLILFTVLCASGLLYQTSFAQGKLNVNIAIQPIWGPVGYDHVEYYYLPEIQTYYNVPLHQFTYQMGNHWMTTSTLPSRYKNFNLYNTRKVVINEPKPFMHHNEYLKRYKSNDRHSNQQIIRDSHDSRYFVIKDHPEHSKWKGDKKDQNKHGQHK